MAPPPFPSDRPPIDEALVVRESGVEVGPPCLELERDISRDLAAVTDGLLACEVREVGRAAALKRLAVPPAVRGTTPLERRLGPSPGRRTF